MDRLLLLLALIIAGCTQNQAPKDWSDWVLKLENRYKEKFSSPAIVHHIYLDKDGDKAFVKETDQGLRWARECTDCKYVVSKRKGLQLELTYLDRKVNKVINIEAKKETSIDEKKRIYLESHPYEDEQKIRVFIYDLQQKNLAQKRKRKFYFYQRDQLLKGKFSWLENQSSVTISRSDGTTKKMNVVAKIKLTDGDESELSIYDYGSLDDSYKDEQKIMLLYRDYSNGKKTYGAGRFLVVDLKKKLRDMKNSDIVSVDLNYSYNPPCAVSTGFHCPLPQDMLKREVLAGERYTKL